MVDSADQDEAQKMKCPCKRPPKLGDLSKGAAGQVREPVKNVLADFAR